MFSPLGASTWTHSIDQSPSASRSLSLVVRGAPAAAAANSTLRSEACTSEAPGILLMVSRSVWLKLRKTPYAFVSDSVGVPGSHGLSGSGTVVLWRTTCTALPFSRKIGRAHV